MGLDAVQPAFTQLASELTFGPPTDISMGWDGTVWAIDNQGAPHLYDPVNNVWQLHGEGVDAAAAIDSTLYLFRGSEVVTVDPPQPAAAPQPIGTAFPSLRDSFKLRVNGAIGMGGKLVLLNGGWYMPADGSSPPEKLTGLVNWPQTPNWVDGVVDAVYQVVPGRGIDVILIRDGECIWADFEGKQISRGPEPVSQLNVPEPLAATGFDAATPVDGGPLYYFFKGPRVILVQLSEPLGDLYLPALFGEWPVTWNPRLRQAPSGRDGNLWSVLTQDDNSYIMQHDGDTWTRQPDQADHVSVGQDGTVMIASAQRIWRDAGGTQGFVPLANLDGLVEVSVGDATTVWGRDTNNTVYRLDTTHNTFTAATDTGQAVDMAANADGTLWHAKPDDGNLHRYLSGADVLEPAIPVRQGTVSSVQKVAATGFGAAYCLAKDTTGAMRAYRYDSPYVFRTNDSYNLLPDKLTAVVSGLGKVFFTSFHDPFTPGGEMTAAVVALDAHTGQELSRSAPRAVGGAMIYGNPVVDEANGLVYVGTSYPSWAWDPEPGQLLALDAQDLTKVVWSFQTSSSVDAAPAIIGNMLVFSDRQGSYAFDLQATLANPTHPTPVARWSTPPNLGHTILSTPIQVDGGLYCVAWAIGDQPPSGTSQVVAHLLRLDPSGTTESWELYTLAIVNPIGFSTRDLQPGLNAPVAIRLPGARQGDPPTDNLYINAATAIVLAKPDHSTATFDLPDGHRSTTGLACDADAKQLWFGDDHGTLYGLDANLKAVANTPVTLKPGTGTDTRISSTPVVFEDAYHNTTVLTGLMDTTTWAGSLYGFDPDNGQLATVPTGETQIDALSAATNGVIYLAGKDWNTVEPDTKYMPVYGVRLDDLVHQLRDFIIESQLMQDPDATATGSGSTDPSNPIPPSAARYQTHLTVVDDGKSPQPREPVKIWADQPGTVITVDGQRFAIGPADAQFAAATTGTDGTLVIVSDATDVNASALRVWAPFMGPYERIVIYPDHEWHGRAAQSYADPTAAVATPDPTRPNLSTTYTYQGTQLFNADQKTKNVPQNVAGAIAQMNKGLNPGAGAPASLAGTLRTLHASNPEAPYVAYPDLGGMHYAPTNARASRPPTITQPVGLQLTRAGDGTHSYTPLSASDARAAINAMTGTPWDGSARAGVAEATAPQLGNIFSDFWNWLVGQATTAAVSISQIVVSVAEDVVLGIQFVVGQATKVFKAVVRSVEDVVNAIGSFFLQLEKAIEEVLQALSVLFHFGEIIKTHNWLKTQATGQVETLKTVLAQQGKPAVDSFFTQGEAAIANFIDQVKAKISPTQGVGQVKGMGTTAHTAMTVGPGKVGSGSSQAVQGSWGIQQLKSGLSVGGAPGSVAAADPPVSPGTTDAGQAGTANPIGDFVTGFLASLSSNAELHQSVGQLQSDFSRLVTPRSASDFFTTLLDTLLDILKTLLVGALAVGEAFVDGMFNVLDDVINLIMKAVINQLPIPVLSSLYQWLFHEPLTILNALMLVVAIPVTVLFRVVTGKYPSQAVTAAPAPRRGSARAARQPRGVQVAPKDIQALLGFSAAMLSFLYGLLNGLNDAIEGEGPATDRITRLAVGVGLVIVLFTIPSITSDTLSRDDWAVYSFGVIVAVVAAFGLPEVGLSKAATQWLSIITCGLCVILAGLSVQAYLDDQDQSLNADLGFAQNLVGTLAGVINPLKFQPYALGWGGLVVGVVDVVTGLAVCMLQLTVTFDE